MARVAKDTNSLLLYEGEDGWSIYGWGEETVNINNESFLVHACPGHKEVREVYIFLDTHKNCWRCQEPVPDGMRALWILHNERI